MENLRSTHPQVNDLTPEFRQVLEIETTAIVTSSWFRASRRSCEFLRYIVECKLNGRTELLKERTIGVAIFRREASYDTGSDAAVRVRASDVRRRLMSYYMTCPARQGWRIELPAGSYIPRFVQASEEQATVTFVPGSNPALVIEGASANSITHAARLLIGHRQFAQTLNRLTSSSRRASTAITVSAE